MRRVVFIAANETVSWGGSEDCWARAAERLARSGASVQVSVQKWAAEAKQVGELRRAGCRVWYRPQRTIMERARRRLLYGGAFERAHLKRVGAGAELVVISQGGNTDGLMWMEAARELGMKYAVISQSANEQWWPEDEPAERLAAAMEGAQAAYFVSEANLELSRREFGTRLERGRVIRNPYKVRYEARAEWPGGEEQELRLACVARVDVRQKAQNVLLEVLRRPRWRERKVWLTLAGGGPYERGMKKLAAEWKLKNVEFVGFVEDIEGLWRWHHALVMASRFEGLPLALVEAMLCGRAAIVTDVGGNSELVRDGVNGFVAKAATVELVDEAMNRAWENRGRLRAMGEAAARDVRELVPADPTGEFVRELEALVTQGAQRTSAEVAVANAD